MDRQRRDWNEIGDLDALWAILSDPSKRYGRWDVDDFLATGRAEISAVLKAGATWRLPERHGRALDYGCGVGRLTRELGEHFDDALGVDISEAMISRARVMHADAPSVSFQILDSAGLAAFPDRQFDCIYSRIVLQHITDPRVAERTIREFGRILAVGGLLVFQVPSAITLRHRLQLRPTLYRMLRSVAIPERLLYGRLGLHPIRMRALPEATVVDLLTAAGATILKIERSEARATGVSDRTYWVTRSR